MAYRMETDNVTTVKKECRCRWCDDVMPVGTPMRFARATRSVASYALGAGSGMIRKVEVLKPIHDFDCLAVKVAEGNKARKLAEIEGACAMATKYEMPAEYVADLRAQMMKDAGL